MKSFIPTSCDPYWEEADWLPPWYIMDRWCQRDEACIQAKLQALLSACERGDVQYRRSDGKTYDDTVHELSSRGKLLIHRQSFNQWCTALEGKTPLAGGMPAVVAPTVPSWAHQHKVQVPTAPTTIPESAPTAEVATTPETDAEIEATSLEADVPDANGDLPVEELRKRAVTADDIIHAFRVKPDSHQNYKWWTERFTNPNRYKKILTARVQKGKASRGGQHFPSWWNPFLIASWLIAERHMPRDRVVRILQQSFAEFAVNDHLL